MKKAACYFNGKVTTVDKVNISPYDIGFLRGYGVFDVMRTQGKKIFLLDEHWKRLSNSAKELNLTLPVTKEAYEKIVQKLLTLNKFPKSTIRTVLTGGESPNGFQRLPKKETFLILIEKFQSLPNETFRLGASAMTYQFNRDYPHAKITNYVAAIKNQGLKEKNKHLEIFYIKDGLALEASTSNFFIVKNNTLITEKTGILLGITRNVTIKLAKKHGFKIEERSITEKELFAADEVFLAATNKDIVPIVKIDKQKIGNGKPGKVTLAIMELFQDFSNNY